MSSDHLRTHHAAAEATARPVRSVPCVPGVRTVAPALPANRRSTTILRGARLTWPDDWLSSHSLHCPQSLWLPSIHAQGLQEMYERVASLGDSARHDHRLKIDRFFVGTVLSSALLRRRSRPCRRGIPSDPSLNCQRGIRLTPAPQDPLNARNGTIIGPVFGIVQRSCQERQFRRARWVIRRKRQWSPPLSRTYQAIPLAVCGQSLLTAWRPLNAAS